MQYLIVKTWANGPEGYEKLFEVCVIPLSESLWAVVQQRAADLCKPLESGGFFEGVWHDTSVLWFCDVPDWDAVTLDPNAENMFEDGRPVFAAFSEEGLWGEGEDQSENDRMHIFRAGGKLFVNWSARPGYQRCTEESDAVPLSALEPRKDTPLSGVLMQLVS